MYYFCRSFRNGAPRKNAGATSRIDPLRDLYNVYNRIRCKYLPRKEVIHAQLPLRMPCYDLVPVTDLTLDPIRGFWVLPAPLT
jgi:hypothetical protein